MGQTVMIHFFKFSTFSRKFWAFKMMQLGHKRLTETQGLEFYKLLGTGGGDGYQWQPDFSTYAILTIFTDEAEANRFLSEKSIFQEYKSRSAAHATIWLQPFEVHGKWSKQQPFEVFAYDESKPIAVLTRARIKWRYLLKFWRLVPSVSDSIHHSEGPLFGKGVGEWPLIQQATFSIWRSKEIMMQFAYRNKLHQKAIKNTRKLDWYSEEMFARFHPLKIEGNLITDFKI